jgi:hypothetical protein
VRDWRFRARVMDDVPYAQSKWCKMFIPLDKKIGDLVEGYHVEQYERHYIVYSDEHTGEGFTGGEIYFKYWYRVDPDTIELIDTKV